VGGGVFPQSALSGLKGSAFFRLLLEVPGIFFFNDFLKLFKIAISGTFRDEIRVVGGEDGAAFKLGEIKVFVFLESFQVFLDFLGVRSSAILVQDVEKLSAVWNTVAQAVTKSFVATAAA